MKRISSVKYFWSIVALLFLVSSGHSLSTFLASDKVKNLIISEVMAANNEGITDEDGDYSDWIEIYNAGSRPVNLSGWALTNTPDQPQKWKFPNITLGRHKYLVVFASGKDRQDVSRDRPLHTNFRLSLQGDFIGLYNIFDDNFIDRVSTQNTRLFADVAYGRKEAEPVYGYLTPATPGQPNESTLVRAEMLAPSVVGTQNASPTFKLSTAGTQPSVAPVPPAESDNAAPDVKVKVLPPQNSETGGQILANSLLQITEIMYNPPGSEDYEFIELTNISDRPLDLTGASFEGIRFVFPFNTAPLEPGQPLVLARNQVAFAERYRGVPIAGNYDGQLSNDGERVTLTDSCGKVLVSVEYDDENGWPLSADGKGDSLVLIAPKGDPNSALSWRASSDLNGSPGIWEFQENKDSKRRLVEANTLDVNRC